MKFARMCDRCQKEFVDEVEEFILEKTGVEITRGCIGECAKPSIRAKVDGKLIVADTKEEFMSKLSACI